MSNDERNCTSPSLRDLRDAYVCWTRDGSWPHTLAHSATETLPRAELELLGVHHSEIARILRRAVQWLERRAGGARLVAFQRRAAGAVAAARDAGVWVPSVAERVAHRHPFEWPTKILLARTAFELDPTFEHEELVQRLQSAGERS
ncbi:MAG: hypothetical protein SGI72_15715 [Planctomycetota bacterium]|nr:hypothetical protein [Planctomycetota bacterium]